MPRTQHVVKVLANGQIQFIYSDELASALRAAGVLNIVRASHVEPNEDSKWVADMSPIKGPRLGPYDTREEALAAEVEWIENNYLGKKKPRRK